MHIKAEKSSFHTFALHYEYDTRKVNFCRALKEVLGWQKFAYNSDEGMKRWVFTEPFIIDEIVKAFPDTIIDDEVVRVTNRGKVASAQAVTKQSEVQRVQAKTESDLQIKGINGEMYPYQKVGVEFLLASGGRAIVADPPGLGKSLQALGYIAHEGFSRSLIIAPASVKSSWVKETKKWTKLSYVEIDSKTDLSKIPASTKIWIINYDILKKHLDILLKTRFDLMVADECHLVKNPKAARTKSILAIAKHTPHIVLLSGTPLLSRPVEMFTLLNMVDPVTWHDWYQFTRRYCGGQQGQWGYETKGATNTEELHDRIKSYFIRRQKKDVLKHLPPKVRILKEVKLSPDIQKQYDTAEDDLATYLFQYKGKQSAEVARIVAAEQLAKLNVLRQLSSLGKVQAAIETIEATLEAGEKILVFSSFMEPLMQVRDHFRDCSVEITGTTSVEDRGAIVTKFQEDPNCKVFFGGIRSAGVGITLTAASNVLFLDYAWNPADMQQAEDRIHRPGQEATSVNIFQLHAINTIDTKLQALLEKKQVIFDKIVEGTKATSDEKKEASLAFREVVGDVLKRHKDKGEELTKEEFEALFANT